MKRYTIGLITGILLTASAVIFMGAKKSNLDFVPGTFQAFSMGTNNYLVDTRDGRLFGMVAGQWTAVGQPLSQKDQK